MFLYSVIFIKTKHVST